MESSGKHSEYQIDDILEEARQLKLKHQNQPAGSNTIAGSLSFHENGQNAGTVLSDGHKPISSKRARLAQLEKEYSPSAAPVKQAIPTITEPDTAEAQQTKPEPPKSMQLPTQPPEQQKPVQSSERQAESKQPSYTSFENQREEFQSAEVRPLHNQLAPIEPQPLPSVNPKDAPKAQPLNPVRTAPAVISVEDEDVKVYVPRTVSVGTLEHGPKETNAAVQDHAAASGQDSMIQDDGKKPEPPVREAKTQPGEYDSEDDELQSPDDMISLYAVMENELKKPPVDDEEHQEEDHLEIERNVEIKRQKKAENFHLTGGLRLSGDEEVNDPAEEPEASGDEDEEIEDYTCYEDTEAVRSELVYRRRTGWFQLVLTGLIALSLIGGAALEYLFSWTILSPDVYVGLNIFLLGVAVVINPACMGDGLLSFLKFRATSESVVSVTALLALLQTAVQILDTKALTAGNAILLAPAGALALFFGALGNQMHLLRICGNFTFVSYPGEKYAAHIIEDSKAASEIGRAAVALGDPVVCYFGKTGFVSKFLENSYEDDAGSRTMRIFMPCLFFASLALAAYYLYAGGTVLGALTVFAAAVCLSAPASMLTVSNFPLLRASRRVLRHGAMLVGWKAADDFSDFHALAVDALELFPSESVLLHGIKTFSGTRIDKAILDAAAVSIAAGGPLSSVFRRVIQNRTDILQPVDTLVYEQDMGMSGWVGGRRVLIGNRRLLENHGVDVPSRDYEARYAKENRHIVYLSTAGELSAMFLVSYTADEGIVKAVKTMTRTHITLLVRTCDPNITEDLVCSVFHLNPYYVEVMSASAGRCYETLVAEKSEENDAVLASNGRLEGEAVGMTCCRRLSGAVHLGIALQIILGALGFAVFAYLSLSGVILPALIFPVYALASAVIAWVLPACHRV